MKLYRPIMNALEAKQLASSLDAQDLERALYRIRKAAAHKKTQCTYPGRITDRAAQILKENGFHVNNVVQNGFPSVIIIWEHVSK